jgi:cell division protein FtsQ
MFRKLLKLIGLLVLVAFLIVTLAFTSHESKNITCRDIQVDFRTDDVIKLSQDDIVKLVKKVDNKLVGKTLEEINTDIIEAEVEKHQAIKKAEVFKVIGKDSTSYKGILTIKVKHRLPVVRVMSNSGNYYLDKYGDKIPISTKYSANVLVATGTINEKWAVEELLPFVLFVNENEFWNAQIEQIQVEKSGDVILTSLVGDQLIELGKLDNYQEKLRNMKAFYSQVLAKNNWDKYKSVSLKYKDQVIAKKR